MSAMPRRTLALLLAAVSPAVADPGMDFFESKVRPLLVKHCYECHSATAKNLKGGLLLDTADGWKSGGDSGAAIIPGKPEEGTLIRAVRWKDEELQMPPKTAMSEADIRVLEEWVTMGAPDPRKAGGPLVKSGVNIEEGRKHWAWQPVARPAPPKVKDAAWPKGDIDRFILAGLEKSGMAPNGDADRFALIRRASYDLTGLPPTVEEIRTFVNDPAPDEQAWTKVVDRLLASPRFGERWGRHWLDVARYADSVGKTRNFPFPFAWKYRDYVIDAFNKDKPFDRFLTEQLAGDLLPAADPAAKGDQLTATGFLALGSMDLNERNNQVFQLDRIDDQIDATSRAFTAQTVSCARCHDHKFDPISQKDYYALAGIFQSTRTLSGQSNRGKGGNYTLNQPSQLVALPDTPKPAAPKPAATQPQGRKDQLLAKFRPLQTELVQILAKKGKKAGALKPKDLANYKGPQQERVRAILQEARPLMKELREMGVEINLTAAAPAGGNQKNAAAAAARNDGLEPLAMGAAEGTPRDCAVRIRGEEDNHGAVVPRGVLQVVNTLPAPVIAADSSGRLELARWLASPDHPLTSRVMANRVWQHLFGRGIVRTVDNFGTSGEAPSHPELLDHLARRLSASGWSVKTLIREIMLSRSYRLTSTYDKAKYDKDPQNLLVWRMNLRRLEVEAIRDSLLVAGGHIDFRVPEGSPVAMLVNDMNAAERRGGFGTERALEERYRSVYLPVVRQRLPEMFSTFDFAEPSEPNGERNVTTVAPQALFLLNNPMVAHMAEGAANALLKNSSDPVGRIRYAYARILCRLPDETEQKQAADYVKSSLATGAKDSEAWSRFIQALMGSAEFRYVD